MMGKWLLILFWFPFLQATILDDAWYALDAIPIEPDIVASAMMQSVPCRKSNLLCEYIQSFMWSRIAAQRSYYAICCLRVMRVDSNDPLDFGRILLGRYKDMRGDIGDPLYVALVTHLMMILMEEDIQISAS